MRIFTLSAALLTTTSAWSQTVSGVTPGRHAGSAMPSASVAASLSAAPAAMARLSVFSAQSGGRKAGTTTTTGTTLQFTPTTAFRPGELLTAVYTGGGSAQTWQFTSAAQGGSGQLSPSSQVSTNFDYFSYEGLVRLADVDDDGDLDLLTMGDSNLPTSTQLSVRLNNGLGFFTTGWSATIPMTGAWRWKCQLEAADVDNDGDLDILCSGSTSNVYLYKNNGTGTFQFASSIPTLSGYGLTVGDVDADGDLDFVQTTLSPSSHVFITYYALGLNNGQGSFTVSHPLTDNYNGTAKELRDLDNNGALDMLEEVLVATGPATPTGTPSALVLRARFNSGPGSFGAGQPLTTVADTVAGWACTDFDNDSDLDVLLLTAKCLSCVPKLQVLYNNGAGQFPTRSTLPVSGLAGGARRPVVADFTGDGRPDLLVTSFSNSVQVLPNLGNGSFGPAMNCAGGSTAYALYAAPLPALGDLDGDGDIDAAIPFYPTNSGPQSTAILRNANITLASTAAQAAGAVQVWPNPVGSSARMLHLSLPAPVATGEVRLISALGQVVRRQAMAGALAEVPLQGVAPGLYLLAVDANGQRLASSRVVVE